MNLLTWNVQWFLGLDGKVDVERVIGHAQTLVDFDVLCLLEVTDNEPELPGTEGANQVLEVSHHLPGYEVVFAAAVDDLAPDGLSRRRFGNLLASRHPIAWVRRHALPWPHSAATQDRPSMPRVALEALILAPQGAIRVITTHLEYYHAEQREAQAEALVRILAEGETAARHPPPPEIEPGPFRARPQSLHAIVCGDFNCAPGTSAHRILTESGLLDAWSLAHPERAQPPTFRLHEHEDGETPIACDFIFVSPSLASRVREVDTDSMTMLSDHQPVWVEVDG